MICGLMEMTWSIWPATHGSSSRYLPLVLFAILIGLSTDYQVFLISRVKEEWEHSHDAARAIAADLQRSGKVILSAATIMIIVFASFLLATGIDLEELGFALAVVVLRRGADPAAAGPRRAAPARQPRQDLVTPACAPCGQPLAPQPAMTTLRPPASRWRPARHRMLAHQGTATEVALQLFPASALPGDSMPVVTGGWAAVTGAEEGCSRPARPSQVPQATPV